MAGQTTPDAIPYLETGDAPDLTITARMAAKIQELFKVTATSSGVTALAGWSINGSYFLRKSGRVAQILVPDLVRTGAAISLTTAQQAAGDAPNTDVLQLSAAFQPAMAFGCGSASLGRGANYYCGATGILALVSWNGAGPVNTGDHLSISATYLVL